MGAGRKPKPTAMKKLEGNPGKRKLNTKEPVPGKGMPDCPKCLLPEAKVEWDRLCVKLSEMRVLTEIDMAAFATYCQSYARWKEAQEHIDSEGSTFETEKGYQQQTPWVGIANTNQKLMLQAASEFGLTPSARSRIVAASGVGKDNEDEMEELLIRDIFGIVKPDGYRQFRTAFVEICKKVGKSELAAAVALYLLYADNEPSAEVYGATADRQQASIVFDVARQMVEMSPALLKRSKLMTATKRIVNYGNAGFYQVLSAEVGNKHGFSVSGLVFDEIHTQPNRQLYDVLTKGSSDARQNPLHFIITTAGNDRHSIAYELHNKAVDILEGRREDPTFYPVVYGLKDDEDWEDEANWYKVNPSLGYTVDIERLRDAYREAKQNPADEITLKWLWLNMWVNSTVAWIPDAIFMKGDEKINLAELEGRDCYAGLDLSSTGDITAFVLMFPPEEDDGKYIVLPHFWVPEETIPRRVKAASIPYDVWEKKGYLNSTPGNVVDYNFIQHFIEELAEKYHILEIAYDRWNVTMLITNLMDEGLQMVPFGQGYKDMSPPSKEFYKVLMEGRMIHGGNPVLRWMAGNVVIDTDPAGNIKVTKAKSKEKIDGIVAAIMALDRCVRHERQQGSVYDERGLLVF